MTNLTAHAQPFRGARDLAFCLKVPLDSLLVYERAAEVLARLRRCSLYSEKAEINDLFRLIF